MSGGEGRGSNKEGMCVQAVRKGRLIALFDTFKLYFNFQLPGGKCVAGRQGERESE